MNGKRIPQTRRFLVSVLIVGLVLISAIGMNPLSSRAAPLPSPFATYTRDGYADLAIGIPHDHYDDLSSAGHLLVKYGSHNRLSGGSNSGWHENRIGGEEPYGGSPPEAFDEFGHALAAGDFDGDGYIDLAIGVPFEDIGTTINNGAVHVLYGSASPPGLSAARHQFWHQGSPGVGGTMEDGDQFGYALAVGDFDGDGYDDLAIGAPYENIEPVPSAGCVNVLYGSPSGLTASGDQLFYQGDSGLWDEPEGGDQFGQVLAVGNFNGDRYDDLAIGVPEEDIRAETLEEAGIVHILNGSSTGLTTTGQQYWEQSDLLGLDESDAGDWFGYALTVGDFDGDSYDDLAVGVPCESLLIEDIVFVRAGAVNVMYGSAAGLSDTSSQYWHQNVSDVLEVVDHEDMFGYALAAGDFDGDGYDDLAVGVRQEGVGPWPDDVNRAGSINVLYGSSPLGLTTEGQQLWSQDSTGVPGQAEENDRFGSALAAGDFNGDGRDDLAVGVPTESVEGTTSCGAVNVLYGSADGLTGTNSELFTWDTSAAGEGDEFGHTLAALPAVESRLHLPLVVRH